MRSKKIAALVCVAALAAGLMAGCKKAPQNEDTLVIDIVSEPVNVNPILLKDHTGETILRHCMSGIARLDGNDTPVPDLAESWESTPDLTVYTVHLRKDAVWTNGDPVTAHDFYFSWMKQLDPDTGAFMAYYLYENIKNAKEYFEGQVAADQVGVKVIDDYTLQVEWNRPMAAGPFYFALPTFYPVNQKAFEEIGEDNYAKTTDQMVTNGAYRITEWVSNDHITMEKSDSYYNAGEILIPKVKLTMIGDANTRLNAFLAGEVDVCNIYSEQIEKLKGQKGATMATYSDGGSYYLNFNHRDPLTSNLNLRKALAYSLDIQSLLDNVINDGSVAADGLVPDIISGAGELSYAKERGSLFSYDPDAARGYLDAALTELSVSPADLKLSLLCHDSSYSQNQAAYLQQQWKKNLGLDVDIRIMEVKAMTEVRESGDYQICVDGWGPEENDAMTFLKVFSSDSPSNTGRYESAEYDGLLNKARSEGDLVKRQEYMIEAERLLMEDMAVGPMYFTCTTYAQSDKVVKLWRTPFQMFSLYDGAAITEGK